MSLEVIASFGTAKKLSNQPSSILDIPSDRYDPTLGDLDTSLHANKVDFVYDDEILLLISAKDFSMSEDPTTKLAIRCTKLFGQFGELARATSMDSADADHYHLTCALESTVKAVNWKGACCMHATGVISSIIKKSQLLLHYKLDQQ